MAEHATHSGVSEDIARMDLTGHEILIDKQMCFVRTKVYCRGDDLYALESNKSMTGYNGRCPRCDKSHTYFSDSRRGFYATAESIHNKLYGDQINDDRSKGPKPIDRLKVIQGNTSPLDHPLLGKDKGIEGDSNSCYMDSTIFCMFAYSGAFDSLLHKKVKQSLSELQTLLKENIVNVLRTEPGVVEREFTIQFPYF